MIYINKNTTTRITLTLNEKRTLVDPYYIFVFYNVQTKVETVFYMVNTSVNKDRYDLFSLVDTTSEDLLNGIVNLDKGEYTYTVYESVTLSLNSIDWTGVVEIGRVIVKDDVQRPYFTPTYDQTIPTFSPTI